MMKNNKLVIDLDKNICSTFRNVAIDILTLKVQKVILKGGRNTTKSAVACICCILFCLKYQCSALLIVEHANKATDRLSTNLLKYMNLLGVRNKFLYRKKPDKFIILDKHGRPTIHSIVISGASDPDDIKSMTSEDGGFSYVFLEEAGNFKHEQDIDSIFATAMRGDTGQHIFVMCYNPPSSPRHFLNQKYGFKECGKALGYKSNYCYEKEVIDIGDLHFEYNILIHHSTYLDVMYEHPEWIYPGYIAEAEMQKKANPIIYDWDKLGKIVDNDTVVFHNIHIWKYNDKYNNERNYYGLDFSRGGKDPFHYCCWHFDKENNDLYCLGEVRLPGKATLNELITEIKKFNNGYNPVIYCDHEPLMIQQLCRAGLRGFEADKYDLRYAGILWLKSLNHIYIDPYKSPYTYKEFKSYEHEVDKKTLEVLPEISDGDDHSIDSTRYSLCKVITDTSYVKRNS